MSAQVQQRELWIYLAISWWIGSLSAWLIAWLSQLETQPSDSLLTASGLLVFGVAACLRLPVLTVQTPTSSLEDHFVWLLAASANVNWLGFLCLHANNLYAVIPAVLIGAILEFWLWNRAARSDCLAWTRTMSYLRLSTNSSSRENVAAASSGSQLPAGDIETKPCDNSGSDIRIPVGIAQVDQAGTDRGGTQRTLEDGVDPSGRRYLAGDIKVEWLAEQRSQTLVIGFVPAFIGTPQVELELSSDQCSAQIINCTPVGLRVQLKRSAASAEPVCNLSWYAKQADAQESSVLPCSGSSLN